MSSSTNASMDEPEVADEEAHSKLIQNWTDEYSTSTARVAILDTGISDWLYEELGDRLIGCLSSVEDREIERPCIDNEIGHGTSIGSIISADSGLLPLSEVVVVKTCSRSTGCPSTSVARGIEDAIQYDPDVIYVGVSGASETEAEVRSLELAAKAKVITVAPVGNYGDDVPSGWPARSQNVIGVGSVDKTGDYVPSFVSSAPPDGGPDDLFVAAQGMAVPIRDEHGRNGLVDGTSQSAAIVAAAVGLIAHENPDFPIQKVEECLLSGVSDLVDPIATGDSYVGWDRFSGFGKVVGPFTCVD